MDDMEADGFEHLWNYIFLWDLSLPISGMKSSTQAELTGCPSRPLAVKETATDRLNQLPQGDDHAERHQKRSCPDPQTFPETLGHIGTRRDATNADM